MFTKEEVSRIWLSHSGLQSVKVNAILNTYGSALAFFQAFNSQMFNVLPLYSYEKLKALHNKDELKKKLDFLHRNNISLITSEDKRMSNAFLCLQDAPMLLYYKGDINCLEQKRKIAIVGTRNATAYGLLMAQNISRDLSQKDVLVVNGLARGIDSAALEGAISAKKPAIAFCGNGLERVYPPENTSLVNEMLANGGLILSEYPPESIPHKAHFPQRNRLISAITQGTLLIEAMKTGGGLITARNASEQGKEVFVLPGPANSFLYEAPHLLIRDGARLVTSCDDIMEDMGWEVAKTIKQDEINLPSEQQILLDLLKNEALSFEQLAERSSQDIASLNSNLTIMEITGIIKKSPGRLYLKI